jgi:hypothetical protein
MSGIPVAPRSADPIGAPFQAELGNAAAMELACVAIQAWGTDKAPIDIPRPIAADIVAPLPPPPRPNTTDPNECAPDSTAFTAPAAAAVTGPAAAFANPSPLSRKFSGYIAKFNGTVSELSFDIDVDSDVRVVLNEVTVDDPENPWSAWGKVETS